MIEHIDLTPRTGGHTESAATAGLMIVIRRQTIGGELLGIGQGLDVVALAGEEFDTRLAPLSRDESAVGQNRQVHGVAAAGKPCGVA